MPPLAMKFDDLPFGRGFVPGSRAFNNLRRRWHGRVSWRRAEESLPIYRQVTKILALVRTSDAQFSHP
jgi:hypothetical protein